MAFVYGQLTIRFSGVASAISLGVIARRVGECSTPAATAANPAQSSAARRRFSAIVSPRLALMALSSSAKAFLGMWPATASAPGSPITSGDPHASSGGGSVSSCRGASTPRRLASAAGPGALTPDDQRRADSAPLDALSDVGEQRNRRLPADGGQQRAGVGSQDLGDPVPRIAVAPQPACHRHQVDLRGNAGSAAVIGGGPCRVDHQRDGLAKRIRIARRRDRPPDYHRRPVRRHHVSDRD